MNLDLLHNFVNPWEAGGTLASEALATPVLEGNVLEEVQQMPKQEIIPTAYLLVDSSVGGTDYISVIQNDLKKVRTEIKSIFQKNEIALNPVLISSENIKEKEKNLEIGAYDLAIGISSISDSIGFTRFIDTDTDISNVLNIYNGEYLQCYVSYDSVRASQSSPNISPYRTAYIMAHELLHQMIVKSFAAVPNWGQDRNYGESFPKWMRWFGKKSLRLHSNHRLNLNTDAALMVSKFNTNIANGGSSKLRPEETILPDHRCLISVWLRPNFPPSLKPILDPLDYK